MVTEEPKLVAAGGWYDHDMSGVVGGRSRGDGVEIEARALAPPSRVFPTALLASLCAGRPSRPVSDTWNGALLALLINVGVGAIIGIILLVQSWRKGCYFWPWQVWRLRREANAATAVVLSSIKRNKGDSYATPVFEVILEVRAFGGPSRRVPVRYADPEFEHQVREGATVPVLIDSRDPQRVYINFRAMERAAEAARAEARARAEQRHRDLL